MRLPSSVPAAAAFMFVIVVVLLVGALLFVRRESAAVGPVSQPPAAAPTSSPPGAAPTSPPPAATATRVVGVVTSTTPVVEVGTPIPTARAAMVQVATATAAPVAASGAQPQGTPILEIQYFIINGTQVAILPGTPTPTIPWWQVRQDATEAQAKAIIDGYLHFWDVRAQALYALQPELARQVMAGPPLENELSAINDFRSKNQAQRVEVDHSITVLWATADEGAVVDTLGDRSTMVDLTATPEPVPPQPTSPYRMAYRLKRAPNGVWQVVDSVRMVR